MNDFIRKFNEHIDVNQLNINPTLLHYYPECSSTNDIAQELADQGAPAMTLVYADYQTSGRGRLNRSWASNPGENILASIIFRPDDTEFLLYDYIITCGLGIIQAIENSTRSYLSVKWPNDILIDNRKVSGILPESSFTGSELDWIVVGFGVNVNQQFTSNQELADTAISLSDFGKYQDCSKLFAETIHQINRFVENTNRTERLVEWKARSCTLGHHITIFQHEQNIQGKAMDILKDGQLVIQDSQGRITHVTYGDATIGS